MKAYHGARNGSEEAHEFDQFLKKLETTKQHPPRRAEPVRYRADSSDNSTFDSRNESAFGDTVTEFFEEHDDGLRTIERDDSSAGHSQRLFDTRQRLVDREGPTGQGSVDSFLERAQSQGGGSTTQSPGARKGDAWYVEEGLPEAILKLDRRQAIPTPRHKNDVLVEIEASTVDRRDLMVRPGVRCAESLPQGVETVAADCVGRVVQVTTHARAIYGISIDDRVAAIYPFEYKDGCKDKGRRNKRYALVDAGFAVTVPKHVDGSDAACMIRLYMTAFQSIRLGLGSLHDRYDFTQLKGHSILVQNGMTELGRAIIDLAGLLGASRIFATGPTEQHPSLMELGAIPLGAETFSWELFLEEKLSLVLVQDIPTADNFEQFISILDDSKGNMVYIHEGHKDEADDLGITTDDVGCDGLHPQQLAKKARAAMQSAKFNMILSCTPRYLEYEGVWRSSKENQSQFKEDLRYLFTLLGSLKPNIVEAVGLEEVPGVQDRIELLGEKKGTIVCLPTALYERKLYGVSPGKASRSDQPSRKDQIGSDTKALPQEDPAQRYASDAGYVKATQAYDTLSDFHSMQDTNSMKSAPAKTENESDPNISLPALPEASSFSNYNHMTNTEGHLQTPRAERYSEGYALELDTHSAISSIGHSSPSNASPCQTAMSDPTLRSITPFPEPEPPASIQFRDKQTRRYRAYQRQKRAKERMKKSPQKKDFHPNEGQAELETLPSQDKSVSSTTSLQRKLRREARMREQKRTTAAVKGNDANKITDDTVRDKCQSNTAAATVGEINSARTVVMPRQKTLQQGALAASSKKVNVEKAKTAAMVKKMNRRSQTVKRAAQSYGSNNGNQTKTDKAEFNEIMNKWKARSES